MKRFIILSLAVLLLVGWTHPLRAQKEVDPPAIPPMLEGNRPLAHVESQDPESSPAETAKPSASPKIRADKKSKQEAAAKGKRKSKSTVAASKKKSSKSGKKKGTAKAKTTAHNT